MTQSTISAPRVIFAPMPWRAKVPEVLALFWVVKVLTTAMGESTSDFLVHTISPYLAVMIGAVVFAVSLVVQLRRDRYRAWAYWFAVAMVSVFGTMCADVLHVGFGIPYVVSSSFFAICLTVVLVVWYRVEGTLSIHSIVTPRREVFYWLTVVTTFALGTAVGDMTATTLGLGYLASGVLFSALIAVPFVAWRWFGMNAIFAFWFAYILTRPVGASFADYLALPPWRGGRGLGTALVSGVLTVIIVGLVAHLARTKNDIQQESDVVAA